jgi:hypothetical protein
MSFTTTFKRLLKRKIATAVLVVASVAAFATLGDGGGKKGAASVTPAEKLSAKSFSLKSNYNYKGNNLLTPSRSSKYIMLNTVVTYQKGNATYSLPLKKKVLLDKVKFTPAPARF